MTGPESGRDLLKDTESGAENVPHVVGDAWLCCSLALSDASNLLLKCQGLTSLFQVGCKLCCPGPTSLFSDFTAGVGRLGG